MGTSPGSRSGSACTDQNFVHLNIAIAGSKTTELDKIQINLKNNSKNLRNKTSLQGRIQEFSMEEVQMVRCTWYAVL